MPALLDLLARDVVYLHESRPLAHSGGGRSPAAALTGFQAVQQGRDHVAQKPLDLVEHIVGGWSRDGDTILDPFLGSGTTLIAAERQGRICYGMEIMPRYCDLILSRWEAFTGLQAERVDG